MKKVLLINSNIEVLPYPVAPLGISLVASSLQNNYDIKVFDFAFGDTHTLVGQINDFKPDYIGISLRNIDNVTMRRCKWYLNDVKEKIVDPIKQNFNTPIILGGSGFSIAPKQVFDFFNVDFGIIGEGEQLFRELLSRLDNKESINDLSNVIARDNDNINQVIFNSTELRIPKANIDQFINLDPYKLRGSYPVQTKRGCTHKCIYCSYPKIEGSFYRVRPVSDIVDEIEETQQRIPDITFEFVDSTFNSPLNHAIDICREIIRRGLNVKLRTMGVNPGEVTEELVLLMNEAGFSQIDCTPDSASVQMIRNYRKNFTKNKLVECAQIIRKHNIPTMWFFMMGGPGETEQTILETFEFIDNYIHPEDMVHITEGIRIIPDTELYDIAITEGVIHKEMNVIDPMFYVYPDLGKENLTQILNREIARRNNVMNSIDTAPPRELMMAATNYRNENNIDEPMFRTLLRLQNQC